MRAGLVNVVIAVAVLAAGSLLAVALFLLPPRW